VCLVVLSCALLVGEKTHIGGLILKTLKKLNGLKLTSPFLPIVDTKHIGRGAMA